MGRPSPPNHIDHPHLFVPAKCAACLKCWMQKGKSYCVYGGPFDGYTIAPAQGAAGDAR